jgi:hypothetical protein
MPIAAGVAKQLRYKVEATFGTAPGASGAQVLRRVSSTLDLTKDTYQSAEIADHRQVADMRHGVRRVGGNIKGELSPGTYKDFIAAALRKAWAAVTAITGASITIAGSGPYTITRAAGSYLTDGIKIGDVVRLTAGSFTAGNLNKNILVTNVTALVVTGIVLNGSALTAEGPIASATLAVTGKKTYAASSSHTDLSYSIEHWYSDISQSELYRGCKVSTVGINLPPTGMAEIDLGFMGQDITTNSSAYYTSPTAATATGIVAAVNGALLVGGTQIATCTGLSLNIAGGYTGDPVVGANTIPALLPGRVAVSGQFTAYFTDATLRDNFVNEDEITLVVALTASNAAAADFLTFVLPRIKVGGAGKDDGEKGLVATFPFTALYNSAGGSGISSEQTTIVVQDSQA